MNTLDAYEKDVFNQIGFLRNFVPQKPLSTRRQKNSIFAGSGDSLVSAMLAEYHSDFRTRAFDPLDLAKQPSLLKNKDAYLVSISGNTIANIKLAKKAKRSTAITSRPKSRLAKVADDIILLQFPNSDVFTAGSISFLESALACISLVQRVQIPSNVSDIFKKAKDFAAKSRHGNRVFVIGNLETYPLAMYCAAKLYEILGIDAHYERIEQFSHMELFSARPGDTVIIFEDNNKHNQTLSRYLRSIKLNVIHPQPRTQNKISKFLFYTFYSQLLPLVSAKKLKKRDVHFMTSKNLKHVSDSMIY